MHIWIINKLKKKSDKGKIKHKHRLKQLQWILENGSSDEIYSAKVEIDKLQSDLNNVEIYMEYYASIYYHIDAYKTLTETSTLNKSLEKIGELKSAILCKMLRFVNIPLDTQNLITLKSFSKAPILDSDIYLQDHPNKYYTSYKDMMGRISSVSRYKYKRIVHFRNCFNEYQGKQNRKIKSHIYIYLRTKAKINGIQKPTKAQLFNWLEEGKSKIYSNHYKDINYIHSEMTGEPNDDIEYLREQMFRFHHRVCKAYDTLETGRHNIISVWYILWIGLHKFKHPCKPEDFVIFLKGATSTSKTVNEYRRIMKDIFDIYKWKFPTFLQTSL